MGGARRRRTHGTRDALRTAERAALVRLRRAVRTLKREREILNPCPRAEWRHCSRRTLSSSFTPCAPAWCAGEVHPPFGFPTCYSLQADGLWVREALLFDETVGPTGKSLVW